eukprot:7387785-Prymnesium_polylepis.1
MDNPLLQGIGILFEDCLILPFMPEGAVAFADSLAMAILAARLAMLGVSVVRMQHVTALIEVIFLGLGAQRSADSSYSAEAGGTGLRGAAKT